MLGRERDTLGRERDEVEGRERLDETEGRERDAPEERLMDGREALDPPLREMPLWARTSGAASRIVRTAQRSA